MSTLEEDTITIQSGKYANFVAGHFWNSTKDKQYFRQKKDDCGRVVNVPRAVIVEEKFNLSSLPFAENFKSYYCPVVSEEIAQNSQVVHQDRPEENEYLKDVRQGSLKKHYDLSGSVKSWTDFVNPSFHPKSLLFIKQCHLDRYESALAYSSGTAYFEMMENGIRYFSEECDNLKNIQLLVDPRSNLSAGVLPMLDYVMEEYRSASLLALPCWHSWQLNGDAMFQNCLAMSAANLLAKMKQSCHLILPLSTDDGILSVRDARLRSADSYYKVDQPFETSAVLANTMLALQIPWNSQNGLVRMTDILDYLNKGRKGEFALCSTAHDLCDGRSQFKNLEDKLFKSTSPYSSTKIPPFTRRSVVCGDFDPPKRGKGDINSSCARPAIMEQNFYIAPERFYRHPTFPSSALWPRATYKDVLNTYLFVEKDEKLQLAHILRKRLLNFKGTLLDMDKEERENIFSMLINEE